jgi:hypothetical protein
VPLFAEQDLEVSLAAARAAFTTVAAGRETVGFQQVAGAVIEAVHGTLSAEYSCPEEGLNAYYVTWGETYTCPASGP